MMSRARLLKPGFFTNEVLVELDFATRLLFAGLWTLADREGRLEDRPKRIKMTIFPADNVDVDGRLTALAENGFIVRYEVEGVRYLQIINFTTHQQPHYKEPGSLIPPPEGHVDSPYVAFAVSREQRERILARDGHTCIECGATEDLTMDHKIPRSRGGSGDDENLQTLCRRCNSRKNNRLASTDAESTLAQDRPNVAPTLAKKNAPLATEALYGDGNQLPETVTRDGGGGSRPRAYANGAYAHHPARAAPPPHLIPIPDPFVIPDEFWEWAEEKGYKAGWVKQEIEGYALQYHGSDVRRTAEEWLAKCQKWIMDDAKPQATRPTARR